MKALHAGLANQPHTSFQLAMTSLDEFYHAIDNYIHWYNNERIQQRLKDLTPMQYRSQTLEPLTA
ncbi:IS3 family transposase [Trueperella pyogenes]|uniref:IS3 family transposase n=1 Tax=Trueperella pyogenes TaxID=1661 RepID=UPI003F4A96DF